MRVRLARLALPLLADHWVQPARALSAIKALNTKAFFQSPYAIAQRWLRNVCLPRRDDKVTHLCDQAEMHEWI